MTVLELNVGWLIILIIMMTAAYHVGFNEGSDHATRNMFGKDSTFFQYIGSLEIFINLLSGYRKAEFFSQNERYAVGKHIRHLIGIIKGECEPSSDPFKDDE